MNLEKHFIITFIWCNLVIAKSRNWRDYCLFENGNISRLLALLMLTLGRALCKVNSLFLEEGFTIVRSKLKRKKQRKRKHTKN